MLNGKQNSTFGVNLVGHITGDFGLAEGVRGNLRAIESAGIPLAVKDLKIDWQLNSDSTYTNFSEDNPYPINLVHTNPNWVKSILEGYFPAIDFKYFQGKYNIGFWAWELPVFPAEWYFAFDLFDEIWTPSNFCAEAISAVSHIPVLKMPHSIYFPQPLLGRQALGLPKDKFIFVFMFDFASSFERKNPFSTIEAFKLAFEKSNESVLLVLKFSNADIFPDLRNQLSVITEGWKSIRFIEGHLPKDQVNALIYNCNCYVSLHRAEGFGLTIAEAMFYGKPVIATAYSANMEFMNFSNSFPVKYELVTTTEDYGAYPKGSVWAEPDLDHASYLMKYVFENYQEAQQIGARATKDIRSFLSPQSVGIKIKNRLELIMKKVSHSSLSNQYYELQAEREWFKCQAQAWKQTALEVQRELKDLH